MLKKLNVFLFSFVIIFGVNISAFSEEIIAEDVVLDENNSVRFRGVTTKADFLKFVATLDFIL